MEDHSAAAYLLATFFFLRGITLFRPSHLTNKFEDKTVAYIEQKMTSGKIKKFIQENMWVPFYILFGISWLHYSFLTSVIKQTYALD